MLETISNNYADQSRYYLNSPIGVPSSGAKPVPVTSQKLSISDKLIISGASALAMTPILAFLAHRKGFSLNPKNIIKTPIKDWALFKYKPKNKVIKFEEPQIISLASASVLGGFAGGVFVDDKSNLKAKKREVLNQLLGNVIVPILCVGMGARVYNKFADTLIKSMPKITDKSKIAKYIKPQTFNTISEAVPPSLATLISLGIGIIAGNRVSNLINEKLYHKKVERGVRATDFAPHVDDLCLAATLVNKNSGFGSLVGRIIPLALLVPGYKTGTTQEKEVLQA